MAGLTAGQVIINLKRQQSTVLIVRRAVLLLPRNFSNLPILMKFFEIQYYSTCGPAIG